MTIAERIQTLLDEYESVPLRDKAKTITYAGNEAAIEARGVKACLMIAQSYERGVRNDLTGSTP